MTNVNVTCGDFMALQRECEMKLTYDSCNMEDFTCTRTLPEGEVDDCTEYFLDRNFWGMIRDSHRWSYDNRGHGQPGYFQAFWNDYHGYHEVHDY